MINPFVVRKYLAYLLLGTMPLIGFVVGLLYYGLTNALLICAVTLLLCTVLANKLIVNPFTAMLEGKGILTVTIDSTGVLDFHVLGVGSGRVFGNLFGTDINVPYDPNLIHTVYAPKVNDDGYYITSEADKVTYKTDTEYLVLDMTKFRKFRFGFQQYPLLVYNKVTKTLITKDFLGDMEKKIVSHLLFVANERGKDLGRSMLGFSRAVVDAEVQKGSRDWGKLLLWLMVGLGVVGIIFIIVKFGGGALSGALSSAKATVANTGAVLTPR